MSNYGPEETIPSVIRLPPVADGEPIRRIQVFLPVKLYESDKEWIQKWLDVQYFDPVPEPKPEAPAEPADEAPKEPS